MNFRRSSVARSILFPSSESSRASVNLSLRARGSSVQRRDDLYLADILEAADSNRGHLTAVFTFACAAYNLIRLRRLLWPNQLFAEPKGRTRGPDGRAIGLLPRRSQDADIPRRFPRRGRPTGPEFSSLLG